MYLDTQYECLNVSSAGYAVRTNHIFFKKKSVCFYLQYVSIVKHRTFLLVGVAGLRVEGSEWRLSLWPVLLHWINSPHKGLDWQAGLENNADISAD